jgi:hypothetical protein
MCYIAIYHFISLVSYIRSSVSENEAINKYIISSNIVCTELGRESNPLPTQRSFSVATLLVGVIVLNRLHQDEVSAVILAGFSPAKLEVGLLTSLLEYVDDSLLPAS